MSIRKDSRTVYTVGHSTHDIDIFVALLKLHKVKAIADVRSVPYSRRHPQLSRSELSRVLSKNDIAYGQSPMTCSTMPVYP